MLQQRFIRIILCITHRVALLESCFGLAVPPVSLLPVFEASYHGMVSKRLLSSLQVLPNVYLTIIRDHTESLQNKQKEKKLFAEIASKVDLNLDPRKPRD